MPIQDYLWPLFRSRAAGQAEQKSITFEGGVEAFLQFLGPQEAAYRTGRTFAQSVSAGFAQNPYLFRAAMLLARGIAGIPRVMYQQQSSLDQGKRIAQHPALQLLNVRANAQMPASLWWQYLVLDGLLAGDAFIYALRSGTTGGAPQELHVLRPDWVAMKFDKGALVGYEYGYGNSKQTFSPDDVLHIPEINPLRDGMGIAPAKVVGRSVDQIAAADDWNTALQQNMARPGGMLAPASGNVIDEMQQDALKSELREKYSSPKNAGRPLVVRGPLTWTPMGMTPTDMDWLNGKTQAARQIAIGLGVAPELLGDAANKTYSNVQEARAALYTEEIFPRMDMYLGALTMWLLPMFGLDSLVYSLDFDRDAVEAIQEDRGQVWDRANSSSFLTVNEKRQMLGYEDVDGGDVVLIPNNLVPLDQALEPPAPPAPVIHVLPPSGAGNDGGDDGGDTPPSDPNASAADQSGDANDKPAATTATGTDGKAAMPPFVRAARRPLTPPQPQRSARTRTR